MSTENIINLHHVQMNIGAPAGAKRHLRQGHGKAIG